MSTINNQVGQLDEASKKEINAFIDSENSKQKIQSSIHQFTNTCFKKCVTSVGSPDLSNQEETCLANCVNSFLDTNIRIVRGLQNVQ